jgi:D-glycero-alpha-D-manno-heptose-7-phosphate kinase
LIISKTPLRVSFLGGGTDYPDWYLNHGGAVISTTIDKYVYITFNNGKITSSFDLPQRAGLATSSAHTVGLLKILAELNSDKKVDPRIVSQFSTIIERDKLAGNIGDQDQYICSMGGFRLLRFSEAGIRDIEFQVDWLNPYLMLFNTHQYRRAGSVVINQLKEMSKHTKEYIRLQEIVDLGKITLENEDVSSFGKLLDESWTLKRSLSKKISNDNIDSIYSRALDSGAIGGKLLGAGGGGFMLFLCEPDKQGKVKENLSECEYIPFKFSTKGTEIIFKE